jgi:hypothetical protein
VVPNTPNPAAAAPPATPETCPGPWRSLYWACPVLLALLFGLNLLTPKEIVIHAFYAVVVVASVPTWDRHFVRQIAMAAVIFVVLDGVLLHQLVTESWKGVLNSGMALLAIWAAMHLSLEAIRAYEVRLREEQGRAVSAARTDEAEGHIMILCAWTKRVQDHGKWIPLEEFLERHFHVRISHGMSDDVRQDLIRGATGAESEPGAEDRGDAS